MGGGRVLLFTAVVFIPGSSTPKVLGQETAAVNGTIRDSSGAIIPAARVSLISAGTSVRQNTLTTDTGRYVFLNVLPGRYTLEITKEGFAPTTQQEATLEVDQTATFDFTLAVGTAEQTITVKAAAIAINTSTSNLGTVVNTTMVAELPLNGRQFTQMLAL